MAWRRLRLFVVVAMVVLSAVATLQRPRRVCVAVVRLAHAAARHMMAAMVVRAYLVFLVHLLVSMLG